MVEQVHVQPQSLSDLLSRGVKLGGQLFKKISLIFYLATVAYFVSTFYIVHFFIPAPFGDVVFTFVNLTYAFFVTAYVLQVMMTEASEFSRKKKWLFIKTVPLLFIASVLYWTLFVIGMALFIIPGIIFFLYFLLFPSIIVMEQKSMMEALKRSAMLVRGSLIRVAAIYIIFLGVQSFAIMLVAVVSLSESLIVMALVIALVHIVILPFQASVLNVLYFDLRAEKEAFDYDVFQYEAKRLQTA